MFGYRANVGIAARAKIKQEKKAGHAEVPYGNPKATSVKMAPPPIHGREVVLDDSYYLCPLI